MNINQDNGRQINKTAQNGSAPRRLPDVKAVAGLFTVLLIGTIAYSMFSGDFNAELMSVLFEIFLIAGVWFVYAFAEKLDFAKTFKLNIPSAKNILLTVFVAITAITLSQLVNVLSFVTIELIFGSIYLPDVAIYTGENALLINIITVALVPAICEELAFRGFVFSGFMQVGAKKAIVLQAVLFSMMHLSFHQFGGILFLGIVMGIIVYKTGSVFCGMLFHFINNAIYIFADAGSAQATTEGGGVTTSIIHPLLEELHEYGSITEGILSMAVYYGIYIVLGVVAFVLLIKYAKPKAEENSCNDIATIGATPVSGRTWLMFLPPLIFILFEYACEIGIVISQTDKLKNIIAAADKLL